MSLDAVSRTRRVVPMIEGSSTTSARSSKRAAVLTSLSSLRRSFRAVTSGKAAKTVSRSSVPYAAPRSSSAVGASLTPRSLGSKSTSSATEVRTKAGYPVATTLPSRSARKASARQMAMRP